jgi:hypothetical protein
VDVLVEVGGETRHFHPAGRGGAFLERAIGDGQLVVDMGLVLAASPFSSSRRWLAPAGRNPVILMSAKVAINGHEV